MNEFLKKHHKNYENESSHKQQGGKTSVSSTQVVFFKYYNEFKKLFGHLFQKKSKKGAEVDLTPQVPDLECPCRFHFNQLPT